MRKRYPNSISFVTSPQKKLNYQLTNETKMAQQRIRELEHHIEIREKELCDIKEAYAEKVRKCDGWEKVALEVSMNLFVTGIQYSPRST